MSQNNSIWYNLVPVQRDRHSSEHNSLHIKAFNVMSLWLYLWFKSRISVYNFAHLSAYYRCYFCLNDYDVCKC